MEQYLAPTLRGPKKKKGGDKAADTPLSTDLVNIYKDKSDGVRKKIHLGYESSNTTLIFIIFFFGSILSNYPLEKIMF